MGRLHRRARIAAATLVGVAALAMLAGTASAATVDCVGKIPFGESTAHCETGFHESSGVDVYEFAGYVDSLAGVVDRFHVEWIDQSQGGVVMDLECGLSAGASIPNYPGHVTLSTGIDADKPGSATGDSRCEETVDEGNYDGGKQTLSFDVELSHDHSCFGRPTRDDGPFDPFETDFDCYFGARLEYRET